MLFGCFVGQVRLPFHLRSGQKSLIRILRVLKNSTVLLAQ
jgi:hypothetical protein